MGMYAWQFQNVLLALSMDEINSYIRRYTFKY